ncbi:unnamed protein product [Amoebophrya sp. A120]|nr:unnamed protein product [Amoebophrya sp. A120]|eukprot:GSA120T00016481001.1
MWLSVLRFSSLRCPLAARVVLAAIFSTATILLDFNAVIVPATAVLVVEKRQGRMEAAEHKLQLHQLLNADESSRSSSSTTAVRQRQQQQQQQHGGGLVVLQKNAMVQKVIEILDGIGKKAAADLTERTTFHRQEQQTLGTSLSEQNQIYTDAETTLVTASAEKATAENDLEKLAEEDSLLQTELRESKKIHAENEAERKKEHGEYREVLTKNEEFSKAVRTALDQFDVLAMKLQESGTAMSSNAVSFLQTDTRTYTSSTEEAKQHSAAVEMILETTTSTRGGLSEKKSSKKSLTKASSVEDLKQMIEELETQAMQELEELNTEEKTAVTTYDEKQSLLQSEIDRCDTRLTKIDEEKSEKAAIVTEKTDAIKTAQEYSDSSGSLIVSLGNEIDAKKKEFLELEKDLKMQISACASAVNVLKSSAMATAAMMFLQEGAEHGDSLKRVLEHAQTQAMRLATASISGEHQMTTDAQSSSSAAASTTQRMNIKSTTFMISEQLREARKQLFRSSRSSSTASTEQLKQNPDQDSTSSYVSTSMLKVVNLVKNLILKLKQENIEDMKAQQMCDQMLKSDAQTLHSAAGILKWYQTTNQKLHGEVAEMWQDIEDEKVDLAKVQASMDKHNQTFVESNILNEKQLAEAQEAIPILESALLELDRPELAQNSAIQNAIAMLEVVETDMSNTVTNTENQLQLDLKNYGELHANELATKTAMQQEIILKNETMWASGTLLKINEDHHEPWAAQKVTAAENKLTNSTRMCNVAESYEARKLKRDQLLESLKSALQLASSQAATMGSNSATAATLVQTGNSNSKNGRLSNRLQHAEIKEQTSETSKDQRAITTSSDFHDDDLADEFERERKRQIQVVTEKVKSGKEFISTSSSTSRARGLAPKMKRKVKKSLFQQGTTSLAEQEVFLRQLQKRNQFFVYQKKTEGTASQVAVQDPPAEPIAKVITLLEKVRQEVEQDVDNDADWFAKFQNYCETEKNEAKFQIENSDKEKLLEEKAGLTGTIAALEMDIENLTADSAEMQASLKQLVEVFEKELAEKQELEQDLVESIGALNGALVILGKHSGSATTSSFIDEGVVLPASDVRSLTLSRVFDVLQQFLFGTSPTSSVRTIPAGVISDTKITNTLVPQGKDKEQIMQNQAGPPTSLSMKPQLLQILKDHQIPAPPTSRTEFQSAGTQKVFGILSSMQETFTKDLEKTRADLTHKKTEFSSLKEKKTEEISATDDSISQKKQELSTNSLQLLQVENQLGKSGDVLEEAKKTLHELEVTCQLQSEEYDTRVTAREQEVAALDATLERLMGGSSGTNTTTVVPTGSSSAFTLFASKHDGSATSTRASQMTKASAARRAGESLFKRRKTSSQLVDKKRKIFQRTTGASTSVPVPVEEDAAGRGRARAAAKAGSGTVEEAGAAGLATTKGGRAASPISGSTSTSRTEASAKKSSLASPILKLKSLKFSDDEDANSLDAMMEQEKMKNRKQKEKNAGRSFRPTVPQHNRRENNNFKLELLTSPKSVLNKVIRRKVNTMKAMVQLKQLITSKQSPELAAATSLILDKIDGRIAEMKKEKQEEVEQKDECLKEQQEASLQLTEKSHEYDTVQGELDLQSGVAITFPEKILNADVELHELEVEFANLEQAKVEEIETVKAKIKDDQESSKFIQSAIDQLQRFYGMSVPVLFLQKSLSSLSARNETYPSGLPKVERPEKANPYEKHESGGSIVVLLQTMLSEVEASVSDGLDRLNDVKTNYRKEKEQLSNQKFAIEKQKVSLVTESNAINATVLELTNTRDEAMTAEETALQYKKSTNERCAPLVAAFDQNQVLKQHEIDFLFQVKHSLQGQGS